MSMKPKLVSELPPELARELDEKLADPRLNYRDLAEWLTSRGHPTRWQKVRTYALYAGLRQPTRLSMKKVERLLTPEHLAEYQALLKDGRITLGEAHAWLKAHGYAIGRHAAGAHRRGFRQSVSRARESACAAEAITEVLTRKDPATMATALLTRAEQVLFEQFMRLDEQGEIDLKRLTELCRSATGAVDARETLESIRRQFEAEKRKAIEEAKRAARRGDSGLDVAARVEAILGA
jgi:hypothetical protein